MGFGERQVAPVWFQYYETTDDLIRPILYLNPNPDPDLTRGSFVR